MDKVNIAQKFAHITEYWKPYIAAELNGQLVKLDKLKGEFVWHHHEQEDEMFLVVKGRFRMEFRDRQVWLEEGEFIVVPRMVEHRPVADEEVWILLFETGVHAEHGKHRQPTHAARTGADLRAERKSGVFPARQESRCLAARGMTTTLTARESQRRSADDLHAA